VRSHARVARKETLEWAAGAPLGGTFCRGSLRSPLKMESFLAGQLSCQKLNFEKKLLLTENIIGLYSATTSSKTSPETFQTIETLRLRFFGISREPRTSTSHVIRALPSVCGLRFTIVQLDQSSRGK